MSGRLIGIARKPGPRQPVETVTRVHVTREAGLAGDFRGGGPQERRVTILTKEGFAAALAELPTDATELSWTARRANLLIEGVALAHMTGRLLRVGSVVLEITGETAPCRRMDEAFAGLKDALRPDWRAGATARVLAAGEMALGDAVALEPAQG